MKLNILIFGSSGMIGSVITDVLSKKKNWSITGIIRERRNIKLKEKKKM